LPDLCHSFSNLSSVCGKLTANKIIGLPHNFFQVKTLFSKFTTFNRYFRKDKSEFLMEAVETASMCHRDRKTSSCSAFCLIGGAPIGGFGVFNSF
jgi:hypothetical protein